MTIARAHQVSLPPMLKIDYYLSRLYGFFHTIDQYKKAVLACLATDFN